MRQQQTFWESSSRPLFVKSVWVESLDGGHRHFILDHDNANKWNGGGDSKIRKGSEVKDWYNLAESYPVNLQLIAFAKNCNLQENLKQTRQKKVHSVSLTGKLHTELQRRKSVAQKDEQTSSKRSSLQDVSHNEALSCDEKLADRVLNWLDLAGKSTTNKINVPLVNSTVKRRDSANKRNKPQPRPATAANKRPDSVKHITIIFNKEGIPVRYNRPARFSDLFKSDYTVSRNIWSMASNSARKKSELPGSGAFDRASMDLQKSKSHDTSKNKHISYENDYRSLINKQILENTCNMHEMKRQLHIFMPSLPKNNATATDCDSSCLSAALSDYCKIAK